MGSYIYRYQRESKYPYCNHSVYLLDPGLDSETQSLILTMFLKNTK